MYAINNSEDNHEKRKKLFGEKMSKKVRIEIDGNTKYRVTYIKNFSGRAIICEKIGTVRHKNTDSEHLDVSDSESTLKNEVLP